MGSIRPNGKAFNLGDVREVSGEGGDGDQEESKQEKERHTDIA